MILAGIGLEADSLWSVLGMPSLGGLWIGIAGETTRIRTLVLIRKVTEE